MRLRIYILMIVTLALCSCAEDLSGPKGEHSLYLSQSGEDGSVQDLLEDLQAPQPQEELVRRELKTTLDTLLGTLNERQQQILRLHYGMEDGVCYSYHSHTYRYRSKLPKREVADTK